MNDEDFSDVERPSKSRRKREAHASQHLGQKLAGLPASVLDSLPLSDALRAALAEFKRLPNSHGARRRQLQFIGKLMRKAEIDEIEQALAQGPHSEQEALGDKRDMVDLDTLCEKLLAEGDSAINELVSVHENLRRQTLRQHYLAFHKASGPDGDTIRQKLRQYLQACL